MRHYDYTPRLLWCLLTLLLLLPVGQAHGQTSERHVTARIVNAETGAPIVDVLCSAWDGERHRTAFTQSDAKGEARFRLTPQDQFLYMANPSGYSTPKINVQGKKTAKPPKPYNPIELE